MYILLYIYIFTKIAYFVLNSVIIYNNIKTIIQYIHTCMIYNMCTYNIVYVCIIC